MALKNGFNVKPLEYALKRIVSFLIANPREIVTIFFENYIEDVKSLQNEFNKVNNLNRLVFNPYSAEWDVLNRGWPKIEDMIKKNKRLIIIDDEQRGKHARAEPGFVRKHDFFVENHFRWIDNLYVWNRTNWPASELYEDVKHDIHNETLLTLGMSTCMSVRNDLRGRPKWSLDTPLDLGQKESADSVRNRDKLFLFNHFYGVQAMKANIDPVTALVMNRREFVYKRLNEYCLPATNRKRPNYIALDFINEKTYKEIVEPLNINNNNSSSSNYLQFNT